MTRHTIFAAAALVAALAPAARAAELYTAPTQAPDGTTMRCVITNVSTSPVSVTVTIPDGAGNDLKNSGYCYGNPAVLAPGEFCAIDSAIPGWKVGYCHFTASSSKVRAALEVISNGGVVTSTIPATK